MESLKSIIGVILIVAIVYIVIKNNKKKKAAQQERIRQMIAIQNVVSNQKGQSLIKSEKQLFNDMKNYVGAQNKEITAAISQLNKIENPKDFYNLVDRVYNCIDNLQNLEDVKPGAVNPTPEEIRSNFERQIPDSINDMIDRAWISVQMAAAKVAKQETKNQKYQVFFDTMDIFKDKLYPENIEHLQELKLSIGL